MWSNNNKNGQVRLRACPKQHYLKKKTQHDPWPDPYIQALVHSTVRVYRQFYSLALHYLYCTGHVRALVRVMFIFLTEILLRKFTPVHLCVPFFDLALFYLYITHTVQVKGCTATHARWGKFFYSYIFKYLLNLESQKECHWFFLYSLNNVIYDLW